MAQEWAAAFYKSKKWQKCRRTYLEKRIMTDGGLCEECKDKPGYIVHHKIILTPENICDPLVSLNEDNLEFVCKECHDLFEGHGINKSLKPLCIFDRNGQPISLREIDRSPRKI
ncbi:MAG: hypothetical protein IJU80_07180 [Lachnospiraceae bacterium]|nr:hypothetical protein [Lachnospiraceae bacterium]